MDDIQNFKNELTWEEKAKSNPLFAIMSQENFVNANTEITEDQLSLFYDRGEQFWQRWFQTLFWETRDKKELRILDYGCGMGRITNQAANFSNHTYGVDISKTQIEYAKKYCPKRDQIQFLSLKENDFTIPLQDDLFDIVYSYAVLQHIKLKSSLELAVNEMCRVLKKNGILKIQIRTFHEYIGNGKIKFYRSVVLENYTWAFYLRKFGFLLIPRIKRLKHTNWGGAGSFYSLKGFKDILIKNQIEIVEISFEPKNGILWLSGRKNN